MELEQLDVVVLEVSGIGRKGCRDGAPEVVAVALRDFDLGFGLEGHGSVLVVEQSRV
jgi:hypothetical protein